MRGRSVGFAPGALVLAGVLAAGWFMACGGASSSRAELAWEAPTPGLASGDLGVGHPLRPIIEAMERGDCAAVVERSSDLREMIVGEVRAAFGPADPVVEEGASGTVAGEGSAPSEGGAARMREALDRFVYAEPPLLVIGEYGFRFPYWWSAGHAHCLAELGDFGEAAEVYALMAVEEGDPDVLWRLGLSYAWAGRIEEALGVFDAWPADVAKPRDFDAVVARLRGGEPLADSTKPGHLWLD